MSLNFTRCTPVCQSAGFSPFTNKGYSIGNHHIQTYVGAHCYAPNCLEQLTACSRDQFICGFTYAAARARTAPPTFVAIRL